MTKPGKPDPDDRDEPEDTAEAASENAEQPESEPDAEPLMTELEKAPPPPEEPVMPTAREAAARRARARGSRDAEPAPSVLRYAFYLVVAGGLLGIVGNIDLLLNKQEFIDQAIENNTNADITNEQLASGATTFLWMLMIVAVVFAVLFALFGYKAKEGVKRARTILTVVTVIVVLYNYALFGTRFGLVGALLALIGTALLFLPAASKYYRGTQGA